MTTKNEAMKLALEALEWSDCNDDDGLEAATNKAINALREALAEQPAQQEPVYHLRQFGDVTKEQFDQYMATGDINQQPAQQDPVVWMYVNKSTHETKFQKHMRDFIDHSLWSEVPLYGEPLANHELQCICGAIWFGDEMVHLPDKRLPPQRTWVGLTDEELDAIYSANGGTRTRRQIYQAIEAKLKEKNT